MERRADGAAVRCDSFHQHKNSMNEVEPPEQALLGCFTQQPSSQMEGEEKESMSATSTEDDASSTEEQNGDGQKGIPAVGRNTTGNCMNSVMLGNSPPPLPPHTRPLTFSPFFLLILSSTTALQGFLNFDIHCMDYLEVNTKTSTDQARMTLIMRMQKCPTNEEIEEQKKEMDQEQHDMMDWWERKLEQMWVKEAQTHLSLLHNGHEVQNTSEIIRSIRKLFR